jgi:hypothetical protein
MKFPKPWALHPTGPDEFIVLDAEGCKLFYIKGDEGEPPENDDEEYIPPSVLFYGEDSDALLDEIAEMLERRS